MNTAPPDPRIRFATDIFMREMKRQWIKKHPSADPMSCPVQSLDDYPVPHQNALVVSIGKAIEASVGMDELYLTWLNKKMANT